MHSLVQTYETPADENRHILQACNVSLLYSNMQAIMLMQIHVVTG